MMSLHHVRTQREGDHCNREEDPYQERNLLAPLIPEVPTSWTEKWMSVSATLSVVFVTAARTDKTVVLSRV